MILGDPGDQHFYQKLWSYLRLINQSRGHTPRGASPCLLYGTTPGGHASQASMQAPFPYQVTLSKRHRLAAAMRSVGVPLASSMLRYPFRRQSDKHDRLPGSVPRAHTAAVLAWTDGL